MGNLQAGTLRAIATAGPTRLPQFPDLPTITESGLPGFEAVLHYGLMAPAGTPAPIITRFNAALRATLEDPEVKARIVADGGDTLASTPQEYAADIAKEEPKWSALTKKLGLRVD
jgi:tripartite-type tricarboxylate transporter receptor subunit TctC